MKNKDNTKPTKKKIITYYLILAACLLAIAGITVGIVYGVRGGEPLVENPPKNDEIIDNKPSVPDDKTPVVDTSTQYEFIAPVRDVNLLQAHTFAHNKTLDYYRLHEGIDLAAPAGTEVFAAVDGTIVEITTNDVFYGGTVTIQHAGNVKTVYKFINPVEGLKVGAKVNRGDTIGTVATATGVENKEGDHLHFEVFKNNRIEDPEDYLDVISK